MNPAEMKFAKTHEWVHVDGETAIIGITDFAVEELTDLVHLELPSPGDSVKQGEIFGEVESVKAASDLYAPVSFEVTEVNTDLTDDENLGLLSEDAFGKGWLVKVKLSNPGELDALMDRETYQKNCAGG